MGQVTRFTFDAAALIAWLGDEVAAAEVDELLGRGGGDCSALTVAEVTDRLVRFGRAATEELEETWDDLRSRGFHMEPCDLALAARAGAIRAASYHRTSMAVSLADCVVLATAEHRGAAVVTSDAALCQLAETIGVATHPIPNSSGIRPAAPHVK